MATLGSEGERILQKKVGSEKKALIRLISLLSIVFGPFLIVVHSLSTNCLNFSIPRALTKILILALYMLSLRP